MRPASSILLASLATLSLGCSDTSGPNGPGPDVEPGPLVTISPTAATLRTGESIQFTATTKRKAGFRGGAPAVTWFSSNESVAAVTAGGVVHGLRGGVAQIVSVVAGARASAQVTVLEEVIDGSGHHGCLAPLLAGDGPKAGRPAC
jgi:hypothetical protein